MASSRRLPVQLDELNQTFFTKAPLRLGAGGGPGSRFAGALGELSIYSTALSDRRHLDPCHEGIDRADPGHSRAKQNARSGAEGPPMFPGDGCP